MSRAKRCVSSLATKLIPKHQRRFRAALGRREVNEALAVGDSIQALRVARDLIIRFSSDARIWYSYGRALAASSEPDAAREAYSMALSIDPCHLMALEFYIEATRNSGIETSAVAGAIRRLEACLPASSTTDRGALDFLISRSESDGLSRLKSSSDPVTIVAVEMNEFIAKGGSGENSESLMSRFAGLAPEAELVQAQAIVYLGRSQVSSAAKVLDVIGPESIPLASLRRSIRNQLAGADPQSAKVLLQHFLRVSPGDAWAERWYKELDDKKPTNWQLSRRGFPLPRRSRPRIDSEPNRVLYMLHNALPRHSAGYATRTHGLLSQLNHLGWDVEGLTRLGYPYDMPGGEDLGDIPAYDVVDNVRYGHLSTSPGLELKKPLYDYVQRYSRKLVSYSLERRPQIIHAASNHWNGLAAVSAANRLGLPSVYEVRGLWEVTRGSRNPEWVDGGMYKLIARMEADAARGASKVLTITNALREEMVNRGVPDEKIVVVPNGVDTERFRPIARARGLELELGLQGKTVIGYIGSVLDYEGLGLLLDAAGILKAGRDDFHVLIVGDGAELHRFQTIVADRQFDDVVTFTGRVPHEQVGDYYSLVDIAPFPRLALPVCEMVSPLKPFEAMAMGKAVVAADVAALAEIFEDGITGLLHEKGSSEDLASKLRLLLENQALRARIGQAGMQWVRRERDWRRIAAKVAGVYDDLQQEALVKREVGASQGRTE